MNTETQQSVNGCNSSSLSGHSEEDCIPALDNGQALQQEQDSLESW